MNDTTPMTPAAWACVGLGALLWAGLVVAIVTETGWQPISDACGILLAVFVFGAIALTLVAMGMANRRANERGQGLVAKVANIALPLPLLLGGMVLSMVAWKPTIDVWNRENLPPPVVETGLIPITVADHDLPAGDLIIYDHISQRQMPRAILADGDAVLPVHADQIVGGRLLAPLLAGEPVHAQLTSTLGDPALCDGGP